jgi:hypothetical protein
LFVSNTTVRPDATFLGAVAAFLDGVAFFALMRIVRYWKSEGEQTARR